MFRRAESLRRRKLFGGAHCWIWIKRENTDVSERKKIKRLKEKSRPYNYCFPIYSSRFFFQFVKYAVSKYGLEI